MNISEITRKIFQSDLYHMNSHTSESCHELLDSRLYQEKLLILLYILVLSKLSSCISIKLWRTVVNVEIEASLRITRYFGSKRRATLEFGIVFFLLLDYQEFFCTGCWLFLVRLVESIKTCLLVMPRCKNDVGLWDFVFALVFLLSGFMVYYR